MIPAAADGTVSAKTPRRRICWHEEPYVKVFGYGFDSEADFGGVVRRADHSGLRLC